jgi:SAM-dependent methyltransferase
LGAGNGWLSYRLAASGFRPIAVDLQSNTFDGLGAAVHYRSVLPTLFPRFKAELDRLPFADSQFDCAIFNASFHYSENYDVTLAEAIRCLRPGGTIIIADSPCYKRDQSGQEMLEERRKGFQARFGFRSDALASCEYLTADRLLTLEARHQLEWTVHQPWYGVRWALRPIIARLSKKREPSQFRIYTARVKTS